MFTETDTIVAPATAVGGALAVIRVAGPAAVAVADRLFRARRPLADAAGGTAHYGTIRDGERVVDEAVATLFRAPRSYTGEDTVEFSCHGSSYVVAEILRLAIAAGARMAEPGEFTRRAYLNGKLDLSQAEAVADLIAASSRTAHALATNQLRGGYSSALDALRERLVHLAAMLELELDFGEEEVAFADRRELDALLEAIERETERLCGSFALGNALKEGIAVAIVGAPNVGKSTLLNRLLEEDRAMVSEIAGTTRDVIEERLTIDGVLFRLLDTAGIRRTEDRLERMGIERTLRSLERAQIVVRMIDATTLGTGPVPPPDFPLRPDQRLLTVLNKIDALDRDANRSAEKRPPTTARPTTGAEEDMIPMAARRATQAESDVIPMAARRGEGVELLRRALRAAVPTEGLDEGATVVSSARHHAALTEARTALARARRGLSEELPTDLLSEEIRSVAAALATITGRGAILPDEVLQHIFSKFCIGK